MPKRTYKQIAEHHRITRDQVDAAKNKGVNIHDDAEMAAHLGGVRHRIKPGAKISKKSAGPKVKPKTLEEIENAIRCSTSIDDVKILKEQAAALKITTGVRESTRELVPVGEVRESATRVYSAVRAELLKLPSDCAPRCEGLPAVAIQKLLREEIVSILNRLSEENSRLYAPA